MTHEDEGHYGEKHPGAERDPEIEKQVQGKIRKGRISCADAHAVAAALRVSPRKVGVAIDLLEARIIDCELGLFGSGVQPPATELSAEAENLLRQAVEAALHQGRLPCAAAWKIAETLGTAKVAVKLACDHMNIKINHCQLGTFKWRLMLSYKVRMLRRRIYDWYHPSHAQQRRRKGGAKAKVISLSAAHLFHDIYTSFLAPVLPLLIEKFALSYAAAGFLSVLMRIPSFSSPLVGAWADRCRLKYIVIVSPSVTAVAMCLIGNAPDYRALSMLIMLAGLSSTCFHVPAPVLITQVAGQRPGAAMSLFQVGGELSRTIGPLVVLGAISIWSFEGVYRLVPLGVLTSLLLHWALREVPGEVRAPESPSGNGRAAAMLRAEWPFFTALFGILVCKSCVASVVAAFLPVYLTEQGMGLWLAGGALSLLQAAALAGVCITGSLSDRIGCIRMLIALTLATPLIMLLFVFSSGWMLPAALVLLGLIAFSSTPVVLSLIQQRCRDYPATANGVYMMMSFTTGAFTVMLAGMLSDRIGIAAALKMFTACSFLGLPFLLLLPGKRSNDTPRCCMR